MWFRNELSSLAEVSLYSATLTSGWTVRPKKYLRRKGPNAPHLLSCSFFFLPHSGLLKSLASVSSRWVHFETRRRLRVAYLHPTGWIEWFDDIIFNWNVLLAHVLRGCALEASYSGFDASNNYPYNSEILPTTKVMFISMKAAEGNS